MRLTLFHLLTLCMHTTHDMHKSITGITPIAVINPNLNPNPNSNSNLNPNYIQDFNTNPNPNPNPNYIPDFTLGI